MTHLVQFAHGLLVAGNGQAITSAFEDSDPHHTKLQNPLAHETEKAAAEKVAAAAEAEKAAAEKAEAEKAAATEAEKAAAEKAAAAEAEKVAPKASAKPGK